MLEIKLASKQLKNTKAVFCKRQKTSVCFQMISELSLKAEQQIKCSWMATA